MHMHMCMWHASAHAAHTQRTRSAHAAHTQRTRLVVDATEEEAIEAHLRAEQRRLVCIHYTRLHPGQGGGEGWGGQPSFGA
jgi:hypothetical protein